MTNQCVWRDFATVCGGILPHSMAGFCLILWRDFGILPHSVAGFCLILWRDFASFYGGILGFCLILWRDFTSFYGGILPHSVSGFHHQKPSVKDLHYEPLQLRQTN